ncbi:MAG: hypothetical protein ACJ8EL_19095, partial [Rhizomicrobium sp.]
IQQLCQRDGQCLWRAGRSWRRDSMRGQPSPKGWPQPFWEDEMLVLLSFLGPKMLLSRRTVRERAGQHVENPWNMIVVCSQ